MVEWLMSAVTCMFFIFVITLLVGATIGFICLLITFIRDVWW